MSTSAPRQSSPFAASFLLFSLIILLLGAGFGAWKFLAARHTTTEGEVSWSEQNAYKVDPETGRVSKINGIPENNWPDRVADFTLIDQTGKTVTRKDLLGKPWAVCFLFTRCAGQCLELAMGMKEMAKELEGTETRLVAITVDPEYDTPQVLSHYAAGFQADPEQWKFLTGDQDETYQLIQESFQQPVKEVIGPDREPGYEVEHSKDMLHVSAAGQVVGKYNGLEEMERRKLVKALKEEAKLLGTLKSNHERPADITKFELTERSGKTVTPQDLYGEPWAVCFVFTRCAGQCLTITTNMARLQSELNGAKVKLVTITVDPKYDTPEVLQNYADNFGADPERWLFLTGEGEYVYKLLRGQFQQLVKEMTGEQREKGYEVFHTSDVLHIDAGGRIVKRYNGMSDGDMTALRRALVTEAKQLEQNPVKPSNKQPAVAESPENRTDKAE